MFSSRYLSRRTTASKGVKLSSPLSSDSPIISSLAKDIQHQEPTQCHGNNDGFINKMKNTICLDDIFPQTQTVSQNKKKNNKNLENIW